MRAIIALFVATFFWGVNFHLVKVMLKDVEFMEAGFWRYLIAVLCLGLIADLKKLSFKGIKENWRGLTLVGGVGLFGFQLFFFWGLFYTSAINAALIISLNPALTLILSNRILRTSLSPQSLLGIFVSLMGVLYLMSKGNILNLQLHRFGIGDMLIFISNILFALHNVWVKKYSRSLTVSQFTFLTNFLCMACFLFVVMFFGSKEVHSYTGSFWLAALGVGGFGTAMAYYLWNRGIKEAGADRAGIFTNIVPLTTALLAILFDEPLFPYHFISGSIILAGVFLTVSSARKGKALEL